MEAMQDIILNLQRNLHEIKIENTCKIIAAESSIKKCIQVLEHVKASIINRNFKSVQEEIHFFKNIKPQLVSLLIFITKCTKLKRKNLKVVKKY